MMLEITVIYAFAVGLAVMTFELFNQGHQLYGILVIAVAMFISMCVVAYTRSDPKEKSK